VLFIRRLLAALALLALAGCGKRSDAPLITREMQRVIDAHAQSDHRGLEVVKNPDGSSTIDLRRRFRSVPVAYVDERGRTRVIAGTVSSTATRGRE
jgi:hypothetical protein